MGPRYWRFRVSLEPARSWRFGAAQPAATAGHHGLPHAIGAGRTLPAVKTLTITNARSAADAEPVTVKVRGEDLGTFNARIFVRSGSTPTRHRAACRRLIERAKALTPIADPSAGPVAELRRLRDSGERY